MKKTYIIPVVKTYKLRTSRMMMTLSPGLEEGTAGNGTGVDGFDGGGLTNSNSFDDQETPWYRR